MATYVKMPQLSDDADDAAVARWLKASGEQVRRGEVIAEIETEKANVDLEAGDDGPLEIVVLAGARVPIGAVLATIGTVPPDEVPIPDASRDPSPGPGSTGPAMPDGAVRARPEAPPATDERIRSSPSSRKLAAAYGVDIRTVVPTGPGGRIVRADVERAARGATEAAALPASTALDAATAASTMEPPAGRVVPLSSMRRAVARRMEASKRTAPHFYVSTEIRMDAGLRLLADVETGARVTATHLLLRAIALAVLEHPAVNASYEDGAVRMHPRVDIGIATFVADGLLSPAVLDCGEKPLGVLAAQATDVVQRARSGHLSAEEIAGGTITLSNLGMYGIDDFIAVLNPPQALIVAAGAIAERAIVVEGQVRGAQTMRVTCSADHRVLDGVEVARFLTTLRRLLEQPTLLLG